MHRPIARLVSGWRWLNWLRYRTISAATSLNAITIDTGCSAGGKSAFSSLFSAVIVDVFDVEGMYMTRACAYRFVTYPRMVRQMLMKRSAPHPATAHTPIGGTDDV